MRFLVHKNEIHYAANDGCEDCGTPPTLVAVQCHERKPRDDIANGKLDARE
jgi:hypothetical protein